MPRKRRPSPTEEEIDRIAETLFNLDVSKEIQDRDSFDLAFDDYFEEDEKMQRNLKVKGRIFDDLREIRPDIVDIRLKKKVKPKLAKPKKKREFKVAGRIKKKIVYTSRETVKVKGKPVIRHRDKLGRFASIKKRKR